MSVGHQLLEGEVAQILEPEEQDDYCIGSETREVLDGRAVAVIWTSEPTAGRVRQTLSEVPVLGSLVPLGVDWETVALPDGHGLEEGDRVSLEVSIALAESAMFDQDGDPIEADVALYQADEILEESDPR